VSDPLFTALKAANRLPSPPAVAMRILELVADEQTTLDELAQVISADPALTAKILKYLNSPVIGLGFEGTTLQEAVARLGTRGAQLLALSFTLVSQKHLQSCPSFSFHRFWSESLARAVAARQLAATSRAWPREEAFITGLVLRLGQLVLATALPAEYEQVLRAGAPGAPALEIRERHALGGDHLHVSLQLLQHWKLPESIWRPLAPLAAPDSRDEAARASSRARLLALSDAIAAFLAGDKQQRGARLEALYRRASDLAGLERERFRPLLDQIGQDWTAYGELLAIATSEPPDLDALEQEADEHRTALRLAAELEVLNLRSENQQLSRLANRDRLTGLLNRGAFDSALATAVADSARPGRSLALLMLDLDRFKSINDRHGHPVGDAVLNHVARILQSQAAAPATVYRYGGEEFALLVPGADTAAAQTLAESLRSAVAESPYANGTLNVALTISIGIASAGGTAPTVSAAALVAQADEFLYQAKQAGRNAVRPAR